jgi:hypothetical protein
MVVPSEKEMTPHELPKLPSLPDSQTLPEFLTIADAAKHRILHQPHLRMQRLWCEYEQGRLVLRGQVPSYYFKQLAQEAVAGLKDVHQVVNEIEVIW